MKKSFVGMSLLPLVILLAACGLAAGPAQETLDPGATQTLPGETDGAIDIHCTETDPHPLGLSIAETYNVSYEQVMTWFCSGYSFENILIALETGQAMDIPPDTLLQMLLEKDWEEIWVEIGFTGET
jgi:hypothetical protein